MALRKLDEIDKANLKNRANHLNELFNNVLTDNDLELYGYDIQTLNNNLHSLTGTLRNIIYKSKEHKNEPLIKQT